MWILIFIVLFIVGYVLHKRKYGVWLKDAKGRAYFGYKRKNVFGVTTARFGSNIFLIIFEPDICTLLEDGKISNCKRQWNYEDIVEWKPYVTKK